MLGCVFGCAGPAAESKVVVAPTLPTPTMAAKANPSAVHPELDPDQPEYWATHVGEPARFQELFPRLQAIVAPEGPCCESVDTEDAAAQQHARQLGERIALPLTESYLAHAPKLDAVARAQLLFLLVNTRDPRVEPAVYFALSEYVAGRNEGMDPNELRAALLGVTEFRLGSCRDLLLQTFLKVRASTPLGNASQKLLLAMTVLADVSWVPALSQKLAEPMGPPGPDRAFREAGPVDAASDDMDPAADAAADAYADQLSWQMTAVRVLGQLRLPSSMDVLVDVLPDPNKREIRYSAVRALLGFGRPAFDRGLKLLAEADERRVWAGGMLVAGLGLAEGTAPQLRALRRVKNPETKARLALELPRLPVSADALAAFRQVLESTPPGTSLHDEAGDPLDPHDAYDALADASSWFQDSTLVPWLLLQIKRAPGNSTVRSIHRSHLLLAAMKLATPPQWPSVASAVDKFGSASDRELAKSFAQTLSECGDDLECYRKLLERAAAADGPSDGRYVGMKAAHRVAQLGNAQTAQQLVLLLAGVRDPLLVSILLRVVEHLLPQGSAAVEAELSNLLALDGPSSRNSLAVYGQDALYRLRARAAAPLSPP